jgi:hypothetical protein
MAVDPLLHVAMAALMREAIKWMREAIRGHQRIREVIRGSSTWPWPP